MSDISRKVLLVDDEPNVLSSLTRRLRGRFEVTTAESGREALELAERLGPFAVVVSDYKMPDMDGIALLRAFKERWPDSIGVMLTIWAEMDLVVSALHEARIFRFLTKPCPAGLLEATLNDAIEQYRAVTMERRLSAALASNIKELQRSNELLEAHRRQALSLAAAKDGFLARISHELRTPLTAILGYTELLLSEQPGGEQLRNAVAIIRRNSQYLLSLIDDVLDLSWMDSAHAEVHPTTVDLPQMLTEIGASIRARAAPKELSFRIDHETPLPRFIHTDPTRLRQVLVKLLGNAVKFTEQGGVRLVVGMAPQSTDAARGDASPLLGDPAAAASARGRLRFDIIDSGSGMDRDVVTRMFEPFTQFDENAARRFGGAGLGLAISKRVAALLGGDLEMIASEPGRGTTFRLTIDAGLTDSAPADEPARPTAASRESGGAPADRPLAGLRLLLAEDSADNQRLIAAMLRRAGANVKLANDGREAVKAGRHALETDSEFDAIVMDIDMPVMDGYAATRELRAAGYRGPIMALTAHTMNHERSKCLAAGCDEYVSKPVDYPMLYAVIRELSGRNARTAAVPADPRS